ncbi:class I SAM-dependent methyltransferase [Streptomyces sp. KL116D]|uniref:class I SAM-dependent methyltransferase n=1 Tax=Streptomyces sp. KL116D TaxID=3045152 RepID=UPI003555C7DC
MVLDIGCGRGTSSLILAEQLRPEHVVGLDAAPPCSHRRASASRACRQHGGVRRRRLPRPPSARQVERCRRRRVLPLPLAAPQDVVGQIARVLAPGGVAVLVTKGLDSYREMDQLVAAPVSIRAPPSTKACTPQPTATTGRHRRLFARRDRRPGREHVFTCRRAMTTPARSTWPPTPSTTWRPACTATPVPWRRPCTSSFPTGR